MDKPPYRVPLMTEINALPWNGLSIVSTFSGCGGSCLGFKMAGYKVLWANEFVPAAQDTYRANHQTTHLDTSDIRTVTGAQIREVIGDIDLDVFEGSPPCSSFSLAGKRQQGWGQVRKYCVGAGTRVLRSDLMWIPADKLRLDDEVIGFDEDGAKLIGRFFKAAKVESLSTIQLRSARLTFDNGVSVVCSFEHRWLVGVTRREDRNRTNKSKRVRSQQWKRVDELTIGDEIRSLGRPWIEDERKSAGWLAGILDGEGCLDRAGGISVGQNIGIVLDRLKKELSDRGFDIGATDWLDSDGQSLHINGGLPERLRLIGSIRPDRLLSKARKLWEGKSVTSTNYARLVSIEDIGLVDLIAIGTTSKTFVAEGLLSHNSDVSQRTDDLFDHYIRLVDELRPRAFIAENVAGLVIGVGKGFFKRYIAKMAALPYHIEARLIDAQFLGVPQVRTRIIFIGVRHDVGHPAWPVPLPYRYSVRDALSSNDIEVKHGSGSSHSDYRGEAVNLDRPLVTVTTKANQFTVGIGTKKGARSLDEPAPTVLTHGNRHTHSELSIITSGEEITSLEGFYGFDGHAPRSLDEPSETIAASRAVNVTTRRVMKDEEDIGASLDGYAVGEAWDVLKPGEGSSKFFNLIRPHEDAPCPTVTALGGSANGGVASVTHPTERRKFSIQELRRICGFPDDFIFTGSYSQKWERMGRAVPPPMAAALAQALIKVLKP